jgi:hypothetical protein
MPLRAGLVKPFAAAWRARAYFVIAFVFWILYNTLPVPFASIPQAQRDWWQDLIAKAVGSLDKISYLVLIAGLVYAVISDVLDYIWANSFQPELQKGFTEAGSALIGSLQSFTSGLTGMTFESVKLWVEGKRGDSTQIRKVAQSALVSYYGDHNVGGDDLVTFMLAEMLDRWALAHSQIWESFVSNVTIRQSTLPGHFEWEERRSYNLICKSKSGELPLRLEGSAQVNPDQLIKAVEQMEFRVRFVSANLVDFRSWWKKNQNAILPKPFKVESDGLTVEYDGVWLRYEATGTFNISQEKTEVSIFEKSYISEQDRCYCLALRHPTRGLRATLSIEGLPTWIVKPPIVSSRLIYEKGTAAVQIEQSQKFSYSASAPGWNLPGVAMVIEWTPSS